MPIPFLSKATAEILTSVSSSLTWLQLDLHWTPLYHPSCCTVCTLEAKVIVRLFPINFFLSVSDCKFQGKDVILRNFCALLMGLIIISIALENVILKYFRLLVSGS